MSKPHSMNDNLLKHIDEVLALHRAQVANKTLPNKKQMLLKHEFNKHQEQFFDQQADWYISSKATPEEVKLKLNRMFNILKAHCNALPNNEFNVLDVGSGAGVLIPFINKTFLNSNIHAIDLSQQQLNNLKERFPEVKTHLGDISEFICHDSFQLIICNACFGNFFSQYDALKRITELLRVNGFIAISHPVGAHFVEKLHLQDANTVPHTLPITEKEINNLCFSNDLIVREFINEELFYLLILQKIQGMSC